MNSEVKYETSGETSEKVVKRLNGKNYLFVPKILTEQHEEASGSGITESGLDSNEEFESDFQTNRKAEFQPNPDSSPVTIITDTTDPKTSSGTTEKMTEPLKPFVVVTTPILAPNNGNLGINIGEQMFIESEQTTMTDDDSNSSVMMTTEWSNSHEICRWLKGGYAGARRNIYWTSQHYQPLYRLNHCFFTEADGVQQWMSRKGKLLMTMVPGKSIEGCGIMRNRF